MPHNPSEPAARELNEALKGGPQALSSWKAFAPAVTNLLIQDESEVQGIPKQPSRNNIAG